MDAPPIDPKLLENLGRFVVRWAAVEHAVGDLFAKLTGAHRGSIFTVTSDTSNNALTNWCTSLLKYLGASEDALTEWGDILSDIDQVRSERNELVHGLWGTGSSPLGTAMVQTINLRRANPVKDRLVTMSDLDALVDEALHLYLKITAFTRDLQVLLPKA